VPPVLPSRTLPADLAARARAFAAAGEKPVPLRDAATVVLLRDAARGGVEAYLLRRVTSMVFAAGMHVFPGGAVDARDADADIAWSGPPPEEWCRPLSADATLVRTLVCAAVRETFEESGVLLAGRPPAGGGMVADTTGEDWERDRLALLDRSLAMGELLQRRELVLHSALLRPWAHWITPDFETRRYDTRFFVAALPDGQRTRDVGGEADRVVWLRPDEALRRHERGELAMLPPTLATLGELAGYPSVAAVLGDAPQRRIRRLLPATVISDDEVQVLLPGDPGYPV
jgi:8-oxo-dGTP pyrophosphatase MutT (NUDIX family)